ncbi:hypothetical protein [Gloeobacter kilaueensis]|uniref:Uncharacterized protein n=1 Tax=Gloeobacter kilaueensis (strain ATCC BAA-2537 / CCAP 1431/1 / ULC 316 / JS1) TaxID=1183438 RepID=U5QCK0_GLOK1|nr:hypothetical protein [Gloeobacter kilaueensis]AGY56647.1 hypothetical protein GKIL_0400 [Gloeobacter kilaueensis JS1]
MNLVQPLAVPSRLQTPRMTDILELGQMLGPAIWNLRRFWCPVGPTFSHWWDALHELGHFAVKPDGYIAVWAKHGNPGGVPNMNWIRTEAGVRLLPNHSPLDPTPDEWGVRAWCLQVLTAFDWKNPVNSAEWSEASDREQDRTGLWNPRLTTNPRNPFAPSGYRQLELMGIDVAGGQFRPTVEVMSAGWQLGLTWQLPSAE